MSKKKAGRRKRPDKLRPGGRDRRKAVAISGLILCVFLSGVILSMWKTAGVFTGAGVPLVPPAALPQASPTPTLAKEYIYAGGKLIATEEPAGAIGGPAPTGLIATATSATTVSLTWAAPAGSISGYRLERSQSINGPYTLLSPNPLTTSFTDTTASEGVAYLYRVRAAYEGGGFSDYSNKDLATTIMFVNDPLVSNVTEMKAIHITQLRNAVDAVRTLAALPPVNWVVTGTDAVQNGAFIYASHVQKLRDNLDPALGALGVSAPGYSDGLAVGAAIKKAHIQELRDRVK